MNYSIAKKGLIATLLAISSLGMTKAQVMDEPIITIHSTAYQEVGEDNKFSIFLGTFNTDYYDIDMGAGLNELEIEPGIINLESGEWEGTWVPARATEEGIIKIYGDPENLDLFVLDGAYVKSIEMSKCVNLEVISLQHNVIENLDLTPFTNLFALYLTDNPFDGEESLTIGAPKDQLAILELDIIDKMAPGFNLSDYPNMMLFDAYHNFGLEQCDPSGCPYLQSLILEMTNVASLDVSKNPLLKSLNISDTRIKDIDISNLSLLSMFQAGHDSDFVNKGFRLNSIDVRANTELTYLNLNGNGFTEIDLSQNKKLTNLFLKYNHLTELDLSNQPDLYSISIMFNDMSFATLPLPLPTYGEYFYYQNPVSVAKSLPEGSVLDLSDKVLRDGTYTTARVWTMPYDQFEYMLDESYYTYDNGKVTFHKEIPDSVYVEYLNDVFYEYSMRTTPFRVKNASQMGLPNKMISFTMDPSENGDIMFAVGIDGASPSTPKKFLVDFGDGVMQEFTSTYVENPSAPNVIIPRPANFNGSVFVYTPDEEIMTSFHLTQQKLLSIDLTAATELREINLSGCSLSEIDLRYNRCLTHIDVNHNNLSTLDLTGIFGDYEKYVLQYVDASYNKLTDKSSFVLVDPLVISHLDLSHNELTDFSLLNYQNLQYIDLSHNYISGELFLTYQITAKHIDLSYNNIESFVIDYFENLEYFNVTNNNLTLETLLLPEVVGNGEYIYAPQKDYVLPENAHSVNLSAQNRVVNGKGTTFTWKKNDGTPLVNGVDYDCVDGYTTFLRYDLGKVYCEMTNPTFPQFTGAEVYRTTEISPSSDPTALVATFTTLNDGYGEVVFTGDRVTTLFIDWKGDGTDLIEYPVETSYISYPDQKTYANAKVKVYTYDSPSYITVFSLNGIKMSEADLSPLTNVNMISLSGSGLEADKITLPENAPLTELNLNNNKLSYYPFADSYPDMRMLLLSNNKLTEFDASSMKALETLSMDNNSLTSVTFDNPRLWGVSLMGNQLESIDLSGIPQLYQIMLDKNKLSHIDINPVKDWLWVLSVTHNYFTFATLPIPSDYPHLNVLSCSSQADLDVKCENGVVDLSEQAMVGNTETVFAWYIGQPYYDDELGEWTGDQLIEGEDYTLYDGVTTFLRTFDEPLMCMLTNEVYPNLILFTVPITIDATGSVATMGLQENLVDVYSVTGLKVKNQVSSKDALKDLAPGLYVIDGEKILVR